MNSTEYCQGIFDAATKAVEYYLQGHMEWRGDGILEMDKLIDNLKRALEGKG